MYFRQQWGVGQDESPTASPRVHGPGDGEGASVLQPRQPQPANLPGDDHRSAHRQPCQGAKIF